MLVVTTWLQSPAAATSVTSAHSKNSVFTLSKLPKCFFPGPASWGSERQQCWERKQAGEVAVWEAECNATHTLAFWSCWGFRQVKQRSDEATFLLCDQQSMRIFFYYWIFIIGFLLLLILLRILILLIWSEAESSSLVQNGQSKTMSEWPHRSFFLFLFPVLLVVKYANYVFQ